MMDMTEKEIREIKDGIEAASEMERAWRDSVSDNISALISIVIQAAGMDEEAYKAFVLRIRATRDQMNAEDRDAAGANHESA